MISMSRLRYLSKERGPNSDLLNRMTGCVICNKPCEYGHYCESCATCESDYLDGTDEEAQEMELYEDGVFFGRELWR